MTNSEMKKYLDNIKKNYVNFCKSKDEQSLFYINQMIDLFYNELLDEFGIKGNLRNFVYSLYKKNIDLIFSNMQEYISKISSNAIKNIESVISLSINNQYLNVNNISGVFVTFSNEVHKNFDMNKKINTLVVANTNTFSESLFSNMIIENKKGLLKIIKKYQDIILKELIGNVSSKRDNLIKYYREFIDTVVTDSYDKKDEIREKNLELINEVTALCLKDMEYININKYISINEKHIKETLDLFDKELMSSKIIKKKQKNNVLKDYLLSFNNTISIKIKRIFDEMNEVVYLDNVSANKKIDDFNNIVTHVFEKNIVIDKQFDKLRKEYNISGRDADKFNELAKIKNRALIEVIRANIFNIFRDNNKIYNDILYKSMMLKNKIDEFGGLLTASKVKELLLKK